MKRYLVTSVWLIVLIVISCLLFAFLVAYSFYVSAFLMFAFIVMEAIYLLWHTEKGSKALKQFIWSVSYTDFLSSYSFEGKPRDISPALATAMSEALDNYKSRLQEKESQLQYFRALADHIDLAILVYTNEGNIEWVNRAAQYQTGINNARTIDDFKSYHPELPTRLRSLQPGDTSILQVEREPETYQMVLSGISFVVMGKSLTVVSMKNIRSVLEDREIESWQKLIRVLTHEIMNSMTPIVSLSELLEGKFNTEEELTADERQELDMAVRTIGKRSKGLIRFVDNYRKVTGIPAPVMQIIHINELLPDVVRLMNKANVEIVVDMPPVDLQIVADRGQIEQVLINLIKNALEATQEEEHPHITISAGIHTDGRTFIKVKDNGPGIEAEVLDRIFIPFFTTKPSGSGIGLSLSRQIMHIHRGSLNASSVEGQGSEFTLLFR